MNERYYKKRQYERKQVEIERKKMAKEKNFAQGIYWNQPSQNAPTYVIGKLSIDPEKLISWLTRQQVNSKGYINLQVSIAQSGKPYIAVDTWEPRDGKSNNCIHDDSINNFGSDADIPF